MCEGHKEELRSATSTGPRGDLNVPCDRTVTGGLGEHDTFLSITLSLRRGSTRIPSTIWGKGGGGLTDSSRDLGRKKKTKESINDGTVGADNKGLSGHVRCRAPRKDAQGRRFLSMGPAQWDFFDMAVIRPSPTGGKKKSSIPSRNRSERGRGEAHAAQRSAAIPLASRRHSNGKNCS